MAQGFVRDTVRIPLYRSWIYHASAGGAASGSTDTGIFLLLAGRTGTTNDPLISTDALGSIYGSGDHGFGLALNAHNVDAVALFNDTIFLHPSITTVGDGISPAGLIAFTFGQDLALDTSGGVAAVVFGQMGTEDLGTTRARWTVTGAGSAVFAYAFMAQEVYRDTNGELFQAGIFMQDATKFTADGATVTAAPPGGVCTSFISRVAFETPNAGDLTFQEPLVGFQAELDDDPGTSGNSTVHFARYGFWYVPRSAGSVWDISDEVAFKIEDGTAGTVTGIQASLWSEAPGFHMYHRGSALFGTNGLAFTSPEACIEIIGVDPGGGPIHTFLNARFADADEANITTPVDGMQYYNSDVELFKFQQTGDWVFMVGMVDVVLLTAQTADIAATAFTNSGKGGGYRVSFYAICTTADGAAGTLAFDVGWDDGTGAQTATVASLPLTATGHAQGSYFLATDGSTDVTYAVTNSGAYGTADYAFLATLERIA